ncbi:MAG: C39 family peptidase, partial [bacterium]
MSDHKHQLPPLGEAVYELPDFTIYKQETDHTCGPAAVRMALDFLGLKVSEHEIARRCLTHPVGTLHWTLRAGFNHFLRKIGYTVRMTGNDKNIYAHIVKQLELALPTIFIYATIDEFHPPKKVTHYGVIIGINEPSGTIKFANPFGRIDEMPVTEW